MCKEITAKEIMRKIRSNKRFDKIKKVVEAMSNKYGCIVAAGGSLVDCYYDKEFYDIDLFIDINNLKDKYKKEYEQKSHILDVLRDEFEGEALDIIVVDMSTLAGSTKTLRKYSTVMAELEYLKKL